METFLGIDYPTWWFIIIGFLITGYAIERQPLLPVIKLMQIML